MHIILSNISPSIISYGNYNVMHKSTLINYFIKSLLKKHSINNDWKLSLCSPIISVPVSIFFFKKLYLYFQIVGLLKTCQKMKLYHNKVFDGSYPVIVKKKCQNQHYWSFLIKDIIKKVFRQNTVTHLLGKKF